MAPRRSPGPAAADSRRSRRRSSAAARDPEAPKRAARFRRFGGLIPIAIREAVERVLPFARRGLPRVGGVNIRGSAPPRAPAPGILRVGDQRPIDFDPVAFGKHAVALDAPT